MTTRVIRRLHDSETGKYPCYLCNRGADSYLEARDWPLGVIYTIMLCRSCKVCHGIDVASEWDGPIPELDLAHKPTSAPEPRETPKLYNHEYLDFSGP